MQRAWSRNRKFFCLVATSLAVLAAILTRSLLPIARHAASSHPAAAVGAAHDGPPWIYGKLDARFTVVEYADLECPYCRAYFPVLKHWIDANPDVNWQWHHLPLSIHEPAATREARLAECAGKTGDSVAFWQAVEWIYQHTRADGQGLPAGLEYPHPSPALEACLNSTRPDAPIHAQVDEAANNDIAATPTLRLVDHLRGKTLMLRGPMDGDALLSAIDLLEVPGDPTAQ